MMIHWIYNILPLSAEVGSKHSLLKAAWFSHKPSSRLSSTALAGVVLVSCTLFDAHLSAPDLILDNQFKQLQYIQYWLSESKASDAACCRLIIQYAPYNKVTRRRSSLILSRDSRPLPLDYCCQSWASAVKAGPG